MKKALCIITLLALLFTAAHADEKTAELQRRLSTLGFFDGVQDGVYGQKTEYAVSRLVSYLKFLGIDRDNQAAVDMLLSGEVQPYAAVARLGDASENVLRVQRRLRSLGFLAFKPDGVFGENTRRALAIFQHFAGFTPTGEADRSAQELLFSDAAANATYKALKNGDKGEAVELLQRRLTLLGFFTGDIDAQYGQATSIGVKAFQTYIVSSGAYSFDSRLTALDGMADPLVQDALFSPDFELAPAALAVNDSGQEVYRLQRRLIALGYLAGEPDGGYGPSTSAAVASFKKAMSLKPLEGCDKAALTLLYSDSAVEAVKPYSITIDISDQKLYVYALDSQGSYSRIVSTMACSTGPDAKVGVYRALTRPGKKLVQREGFYLRYVFQLDGSLTISSIPYYDQSSFDKARLDALGTPMPDGGVMLSLQNARLIWEKCPARTSVSIVE